MCEIVFDVCMFGDNAWNVINSTYFFGGGGWGVYCLKNILSRKDEKKNALHMYYLAVWTIMPAFNKFLCLAGLLLGQAFFKDFKRYPWQDGAGWLNLFLFMAFLGFAVIFNIVYRGYPREDYS